MCNGSLHASVLVDMQREPERQRREDFRPLSEEELERKLALILERAAELRREAEES